jgi:hypothetical protein
MTALYLEEPAAAPAGPAALSYGYSKEALIAG